MEKEKKKIRMISLTILGEAVGKTCICKAFLGYELQSEFVGTNYEFFSEMTMSDGNKVKIKLWDTAGQERYRSTALHIFRISEGGIVVFDVTNKQTFENLNYWLEQIRVYSQDRPVVLFGNKCDEKRREVSYDEAKQFADKNGILYFETSAENNTGIKEGIETICEIVYKKIEKNQNDNRERKRNNKCEIY